MALVVTSASARVGVAGQSPILLQSPIRMVTTVTSAAEELHTKEANSRDSTWHFVSGPHVWRTGGSLTRPDNIGSSLHFGQFAVCRVERILNETRRTINYRKPSRAAPSVVVFFFRPRAHNTTHNINNEHHIPSHTFAETTFHRPRHDSPHTHDHLVQGATWLGAESTLTRINQFYLRCGFSYKMPICTTFATTALGAGVWDFKYNRMNYMFDQSMRFNRFTAGCEMACRQAGMYREDVRDLTNLTVEKQARYHVIGTIMFVCSIQLVIAGRLGVHGPAMPGWHMSLYWATVTFSFLWLVVSTWLSMHAAARAHSGVGNPIRVCDATMMCRRCVRAAMCVSGWRQHALFTCVCGWLVGLVLFRSRASFVASCFEACMWSVYGAVLGCVKSSW